MDLPDPAFDNRKGISAIAAQALTSAASDHAPLSDNQQTFLALALASDLEMTNVANHPDVRAHFDAIVTQKQAAEYMSDMIRRVRPA